MFQTWLKAAKGKTLGTQAGGNRRIIFKKLGGQVVLIENKCCCSCLFVAMASDFTFACLLPGDGRLILQECRTAIIALVRILVHSTSAQFTSWIYSSVSPPSFSEYFLPQLTENNNNRNCTFEPQKTAKFLQVWCWRRREAHVPISSRFTNHHHDGRRMFALFFRHGWLKLDELQ